MTKNNQRTDEAAAIWAVRLNQRALTEQEQADLAQWLDEDSRHRGALLRARAAWSDLDRLSALSGPASSASAADLDAGSAAQAKPPRKIYPRFIGNRRRFVAAAAAAMILGGAGALWVERRDQTYVSKLGQVRRVKLSDGSAMVLNTATEATVRFDKTRREIELTAGEGLFHVAKDPARPFIVRAGFVSVRAVGTIFAVRSAGQSVDVTVTEGVVELVDNSAPGGRVIRSIAANEHATVMETSQVQVRSMPHVEAERRLAWRDGMVDFAGEPLTMAVGEVNRHNQRQIIVDDPTLASRPVVGVFRANDPDNFAATVAAALGADSVVKDDVIHLRPRANR